MPTTKAIGIDPGEKGAASFLKHTTRKGWAVEKVIDFDVILCTSTTGKVERTEPDYALLNDLCQQIKRFNPDSVTVEWQQTWGSDSSRSGFALGGWYCALRMGLQMMGLEPHIPDPKTWKAWSEYKPYGLYGAKEEGKAVGIDICGKLFPDDFDELFCPLWKNSKTRRRLPHDGRTDATLIGLYGAIGLSGAPMFKVRSPEFRYGVKAVEVAEVDSTPVGELVYF